MHENIVQLCRIFNMVIGIVNLQEWILYEVFLRYILIHEWMNIYIVLLAYYIDYKYIHVCHLKHTYKETQIYTY